MSSWRVGFRTARAAALCRRRAALDAAAESYVRLVLALAERDADSLDIYHGPPAWEQDARARRPSLDDTRSAAATLSESVAAIAVASGDDEIRRTFLIRQLRAVVTRIDIVRGARPPFAEEARALFGLEGPGGRKRQGQPARQRQEVRAQLERLLPGPAICRQALRGVRPHVSDRARPAAGGVRPRD